MFSCNLRFRLIFLHGCSRTHCVASLRAVPVGRISYNLYFDCKHVRSVTCDLINEYTFLFLFLHETAISMKIRISLFYATRSATWLNAVQTPNSDEIGHDTRTNYH